MSTASSIKRLLENLFAFANNENRKYPSWSKEQALYNCTTVAFPHLLKHTTEANPECNDEDCRISHFIENLEKTLKTEKPFVGIFWFYHNVPLFVHAVHLDEGQQYGKAITGIKDHADYWEEGADLQFIPGHLQKEYFLIPRGRIVYHEDTDRFTVYHGNNMNKQELTDVATVFCLPKNKTRFEQDMHYCHFTEDEWNYIIT